MAEHESVELDNSLEGLDELIDRALAGEPKRTASPTPAAEADDEIIDDDEGEPDEGPEGDDEESDDEVGDDEDEEADDDEEEEEEEEEGEEEEEEEEETDLNVSAAELKRIREDPALAKLEKLMRRDYTDKTTKFAEEKREWEERVEITESFQEKVKTPEGMARYLSATMERHPIIVGAAFEAIATGDKAKDFLIAVGEAKPEVFEEAYDQLQELLADDDARKQYHRTREFQSKESELEEREDRLRRGTFQRQYGSLWSAVEKEASRMKLDAEDLKEVEARLHERLEGHVRQDGSITLRPQDAKEVVKETKELLDRQYERALKKLGKTRVKESREAVKKKARTAQSNVGRAAPRSAPRKAPREHTRFKHDGKGDPLDSFIDHRLG